MGPDPSFRDGQSVPEIMREAAVPRIVATGVRLSEPDQQRPVFPGSSAGSSCKARGINDEMLLAAAHTIAATVPREELREDYIIPGVFNRAVPERVARAVRKSAVQTGMARLKHRYASFYK